MYTVSSVRPSHHEWVYGGKNVPFFLPPAIHDEAVEGGRFVELFALRIQRKQVQPLIQCHNE